MKTIFWAILAIILIPTAMAIAPYCQTVLLKLDPDMPFCVSNVDNQTTIEITVKNFLLGEAKYIEFSASTNESTEKIILESDGTMPCKNMKICRYLLVKKSLTKTVKRATDFSITPVETKQAAPCMPKIILPKLRECQSKQIIKNIATFLGELDYDVAPEPIVITNTTQALIREVANLTQQIDESQNKTEEPSFNYSNFGTQFLMGVGGILLLLLAFIGLKLLIDYGIYKFRKK